MQRKVFCSHGVLGHEKRNFYSVHAPASDIYDTVDITIPDSIVIGVNDTDDVILDLGGVRYLLSEALTNDAYDNPVLRWHNGRSYQTINLGED